ncbi:hypothetical protein GCM10025779_18840 [Arthrobacter cryoconiti]
MSSILMAIPAGFRCADVLKMVARFVMFGSFGEEKVVRIQKVSKGAPWPLTNPA